MMKFSLLLLAVSPSTLQPSLFQMKAIIIKGSPFTSQGCNNMHDFFSANRLREIGLDLQNYQSKASCQRVIVDT